MSYVMALDQGTSSSRAIVFDAQGQALSTAQHEFDQQFPRDGWVEQDPETLWQTTLAAGRDALAASGLRADQLLGIGITNQRETTLVWDRKTGEPVANAIGWQDGRTSARCEEIRRDGMADRITEKTGLVIDPYFSGTKLAWILDNVAGARARADAGGLLFGTVDCFLIWRLSKGAAHRTDASNASRTQLFNLAQQCWDEELLEYFAIPESMLPEVMESCADFGHCDPEWFGAALPILGVAGDQQAAMIGQGCFEAGMSKSTYGTGCFLISNTGPQQIRSSEGLLTTVAYRLNGETCYALEGSIFVAGVAVKWLRDQLGLIDSAADTEAAARRCNGDSGGVYAVPAFTGLGAPHWSPEARGLICGLTLDTNADQFITALVASVAYQSADLLDAFARDGARITDMRVDGGMVSNDWLCQHLADLCQVSVQRPANIETTALGAAMLGLLGGGALPSLAAAGSLWQLDRHFKPELAEEARQRLMSGWHAAVSRTLGHAVG
jgi:glycerol kinase